MTLASTVALGACSTGGLRPQSTALQPARLRAEQTLGNVALSPAAWPRSDWWSSFGDPQLDRIVGEALADSPTFRHAEARVRTPPALEGAAGASPVTEETRVGHERVRQSNARWSAY